MKTNQFQLERMTAGDLDAVVQMESSDGAAGWSRAQFEKDLSLEFSRFFVIHERPNILGYGGFWKVGGDAQITNLVIVANRRRQGLGKMLLEFLLEQARQEGCKSVTLEVRRANTAAQGLYRSLGFITQAYRAKTYTNPVDDAILMQKDF